MKSMKEKLFNNPKPCDEKCYDHRELLEIMLESGYLLGCSANYRDAESCFRSVISLEPSFIGGWLGLGNVLLMSGRPQEAESAYCTVLKNDPDDPAARAFLGELLLCTQRVEEGRNILASVYLDNPNTNVGKWAVGLLEISEEIQQ